MTTAAKHITVRTGERACINCTQYQQCFREETVPGEVYKKAIPVSFGYCTLHDCHRGALRRPCKNYKTPEREGIE